MEELCVILLHVPKTGGSTLKRAIKWKYPSKTLFLETLSTPLASIPERVPLERRREARAVVGHLHYGVHEHFPQDCAYVTVLREPVSRVISSYYYIKSDPRHWLHDELVGTGMGLEEFVRSSADPGVDNEQTQLIAGVGSGELHSGRPPAALGPAELELAKRNLEKFLVVGVNERFDESFILIRRALGWKLPMYVSSRLASGPKPATASEIELIRERNRLDLELYAFAEQLMADAIAAQPPSFRREVAAFRLLNRVPEAIGPRIPAPVRRGIRSVLPR